MRGSSRGLARLCSGPMSTPPGPFASPENAALRPIQMVSVAVGMGALMLSAVRILVDPSAPMPSPWAVGIVLAALICSATLIRYVGSAVPALPHGLPRENAETTSLRYFTSTTTLRTALAEAPVLVAFACSFVFTPHSWLTLLIACRAGSRSSGCTGGRRRARLPPSRPVSRPTAPRAGSARRSASAEPDLAYAVWRGLRDRRSQSTVPPLRQ